MESKKKDPARKTVTMSRINCGMVEVMPSDVGRYKSIGFEVVEDLAPKKRQLPVGQKPQTEEPAKKGADSK